MTAPTEPLLVTRRLELWLPTGGDLPEMLALLADPNTTRFLGRDSSPADQFARFCRNAGSWQLYGYGGFMVRLRDQLEVIGQCGIFQSWRGLGADFDDMPEAGWIIRHDHCEHGYAREAMEAALDWFETEHGPRRIVCMIAPENAPSLRLAERLGFAAMREAVMPGGDGVRLLERSASMVSGR